MAADQATRVFLLTTFRDVTLDDGEKVAVTDIVYIGTDRAQIETMLAEGRFADQLYNERECFALYESGLDAQVLGDVRQWSTILGYYDRNGVPTGLEYPESPANKSSPR